MVALVLLGLTVSARPPEWPVPGFQQYSTCSSSNARDHTMAQMSVSFTNTCAEVSSEILARAGSGTKNDDGWKDPHNRGHYFVEGANSNLITTKRYTGNWRYEDVQTFALTATASGGCNVNACSVSQGNSNNDGGTNMCDMMDLFCNTSEKNDENGVTCTAVKTNLAYTVDSLTCGRYQNDGQYLQHECQNFQETCLRDPTDALTVAVPEPVLSKPPEWPNPNFQLFSTCHSSNARQHTMAEMTVEFTNTCAEVAGEILARAGSGTKNDDGWVDPHNMGHYFIDSSNSNLITTKRYTERWTYNDVQTFAMTASASGGCSVNACSVSQGNSNNDGGTNMCDMMDLFCNSSEENEQTGVSCKPVKTNLAYTVKYLECGRYENDGQYRQHECQNFQDTCLRNPTNAYFLAKQPEAVVRAEAPVLSRPPEWPNPGFVKYSTCAGSYARQHTMAQMSVSFTNTCAQVSAEVLARAGSGTKNDDGWKDPHNRGHYYIKSSTANLITTKRYTGNWRYQDVQTFALTSTASGGCNMNACSVSQGNSNNDGGTNMCDMMDLFCNSSEKNDQNGVTCTPVKTNLSYTVNSLECGRYENDGAYRQHECQNFQDTCLRDPTDALERPAHVLSYLFQ